MNQTLTLSSDCRWYWSGGAKYLMGTHHADVLDDPYAMLLNSLVGIVLFVSILWFKQGASRVWRIGIQHTLVDTHPRLAGIVLCFASISGYQNVGAATTIAVLVASQLIGDWCWIFYVVTACLYGRWWAHPVARCCWSSGHGWWRDVRFNCAYPTYRTRL